MATHPNWKQELKSFMVEHSEDMANVTSIDAEIDLWEHYWDYINEKKLSPHDIESPMDAIIPSMYPNIYKVLHLLAVLPVTTCSCERSISTLRRVKTYLRNSMTQVCTINSKFQNNVQTSPCEGMISECIANQPKIMLMCS